jgi:hypothetical protein
MPSTNVQKRQRRLKAELIAKHGPEESPAFRVSIKMRKLFTERHGEGKPRVAEELNEAARTGLLNLVSARIDEEWFGLSFPSGCSDGYVYAGTNFTKLKRTMEGYGLLWPIGGFDQDSPPSDGDIFDLVEFAYEFIAEALDPWLHSFMSHSHYSYNRQTGRDKFARDVNRILERNGIAFELKQGEVIRVAPAVLNESLVAAIFKTGDAILDELLEVSRQKFLNRSAAVRLESLEKLWDAWERLKTVEIGSDKKERVKALLDKAAVEPNFRERLEKEALELSDIGNKFMIRHTETDKVPIVDSLQVDYLFQRMFSIILLLLKASGRTE